MQGARAICSLCPAQDGHRGCQGGQGLSGLILAPSLHIAQIPSSASPPKGGGVGTRPLCGHRTPSTTLQQRPGPGSVSRPGLSSVFIPGPVPSPFGGRLHLASAPPRPSSPSAFETRSATTPLVSSVPPAARDLRSARLGRSRLALCWGPARVKPDRSRRAVGSCPPCLVDSTV